MSVALVTLIVLLAMDLRMSLAVPNYFVDQFTDLVNKRQFKGAFELCRNDTSYIARVLTAGMGRLQYGIEDAREACFNMVDSVRAGKDNLITYLGTIGTLGPMLGLVGTVYGMIMSFMELSLRRHAQAGKAGRRHLARPGGDAAGHRHLGPGHFLLLVLQESPHPHLDGHQQPGRRPVDADVPQLEKGGIRAGPDTGARGRRGNQDGTAAAFFDERAANQG